MNKENADKVIKDTIEYANEEIKKSKKRYLKICLIIFGLIALLIILYLLMFKYETPVKYSKDMIDVDIPTDKGIDININLTNYKNANAILVKIDKNTYDIYMNITQTLSTKIFKDNDKSNNLLRVGNNIIVDFQSGRLRAYMPNENNYENIGHVYYIDNSLDKITIDSELMNYENKTLIWEKE